MFLFLGVEDGYEFHRIFGIGMSSVVSLGVTGWVSFSVTSHGITGYVALIPGAVASVFLGVTSMFPARFSVGSTMSVIK